MSNEPITNMYRRQVASMCTASMVEKLLWREFSVNRSKEKLLTTLKLKPLYPNFYQLNMFLVNDNCLIYLAFFIPRS